MDSLAPLIAIGLLVLTHIGIGYLRFLSGTPRSVWLSVAGGVSVAYVFVHLLPDLGDAQESLSRALPAEFQFLEHHVYLVALIGLVIFYGLERAAVTSRRRERAGHTQHSKSAAVFWLHMVAFAAYNLLIGYLIHHRATRTLVFFTVAMALHFAVTDFGMRENFRDRFDRIGRWVFVCAVILGWAIGLAFEISEGAQAALLGFLAGGVNLNVIKEELPEERESRFWPFAAGATAYAILLLLA